jgi:hypothetical protein
MRGEKRKIPLSPPLEKGEIKKGILRIVFFKRKMEEL